MTLSRRLLGHRVFTCCRVELDVPMRPFRYIEIPLLIVRGNDLADRQ